MAADELNAEFIGWLVLAPLVGGYLCSSFEERLTGRSRSEHFRKLRLRALAIAYVLGLVVLNVLARLPFLTGLSNWLQITAVIALAGAVTVVTEFAIYRHLVLKYLKRALGSERLDSPNDEDTN
jgi:hypothetical protein